MACRLVATEPPNIMIISVPPAIMNQVLTSMLRATSPRRIASSRRLGVGSSVRSFESEFSSAMRCAYPCGVISCSTPPT